MEGTCRKWEELKGEREGKKRSEGERLERARKEGLHLPLGHNQVHCVFTQTLRTLYAPQTGYDQWLEKGGSKGETERKEGRSERKI